MKYSSKYLTKLGCYELGHNIYENWVTNCGFQPIDKYLIIKNYNDNLVKHNRLIKKFPFFIEIHSMFGFSNKHIYKKLYSIYGLPEGECLYFDIHNVACNPIFSINVTFSAKTNHTNCDLSPKTILIPHSHIGNWCLLFLDSDAFDCGFERIYVKNKEILDWFITATILGDHNSYNILD